MTTNEAYLGDGLYASYDGFGFMLRAPRERGDDKCYLEPSVFVHFLKFVKLANPKFAAALKAELDKN